MGLHAKLLKTAAAIAAMAISPEAHADTPPPYVATFGTCGPGPGQFLGLWGIAAGPDGSLCKVTKYGKEPPVPARPVTWGAIKAVDRYGLHPGRRTDYAAPSSRRDVRVVEGARLEIPEHP